MRTLQAKVQPDSNSILISSDQHPNLYSFFYYGVEIPFPVFLVKDNNRGWTFENHTITHNRTLLFFSRGEFEMIEE